MARVLVVEDSAVCSSIVKFALEAAGYETYVAADAVTALEKVRTWHPDAVILDINLPGLSGFDVAKGLREMEGLKGLPIIVVSALDQETNVQRAYSLGATAYLPKPLNVEELLLVLEAALG